MPTKQSKTDDLSIRLKDHIIEEQSHITEIKEDIKSIKENHLAHIQEAMTSMKITTESLKTDMDWVKKFFWIIAGASIGGLVTGLINLIVKIKS